MKNNILKVKSSKTSSAKRQSNSLPLEIGMLYHIGKNVPDRLRHICSLSKAMVNDI